jgi:hypothetical protein
MSAAYAPELQVPSIGTEQITVSETTPSKDHPPKAGLLPHSITVSTEAHTETRRSEPLFGTHIREAASIVKDWLGE